MRVAAFKLGITLLLVSLTVSTWAQGDYPGNAVRVNGKAISNERFNGFYEAYRNTKGVAIGARGDQLEMLKQLRREAMDLMVDQELVAQEAEAQGVEVDPAEVEATLAQELKGFRDEENFLQKLREGGYTEEEYRDHLRRMLAAKHYLDRIRMSVAEVSDEELEDFYRNNEKRLTLPEQVRVRHILLSWKPLGKGDDRAALREQMAPILEQARAGSDFAELARKHSEDSTAENGGDTGFFYPGQMVQAFERAAFALQPGEISDMVETPYGVHILKLEERKEAQLLPLDEVSFKLRGYLSDQKQEEAVAEETARLREKAEIETLIMLERPERN